VGMIFFVYNLGWSVNRRVDAQNTADSVAISAGLWIARSMNVAAMSNVSQSRMIALVPVLDALPLATEMTIAEQTGEDSLPVGLEQQFSKGIPDTRIEQGYDLLERKRTNFLRNGLGKLLREMSPGKDKTQYDALIAIDDSFDSPDERDPEGDRAFEIRKATHWRLDDADGPPPHGYLWKATEMLGEFGRAAIESGGYLAQTNAVEYGLANRAATAFVSPIAPVIPAKMGTFHHFEPVLTDYLRVTSNGARMVASDLVTRLSKSSDILREIEDIHIYGGAIPDWEYPHRLGPWARLFRWRSPYRRYFARESYGAPDDEIPPAHRGGYQKVIGYRATGPFHWAVNVVLQGMGLAGRRLGALETTRFAFHLRRVATLKLAYMFGLPAPQSIQYADKWITDYEQAKQFAADPENRKKILRTRYYRPAILSSVSWDDPDWLKDPKTYYSHRHEVTPFSDPKAALWVWEPRGWYDVAARRGSCEKLGDYIWRRKRQYKVVCDWRVNLPPRFDPKTGEPILWDVYYVSWYVFGGIEIRDEVEITNPCNWNDDDELPAPILLDTSDGDYGKDGDDGWRREKFTYLGVVRNPGVAEVWNQRFSTANPDHSVLTVAQVQVFNNKSWDLWTQDWRAQLVPVTKWADWQGRLERDVPGVEAMGGLLTEEEVTQVLQYISALSPEMVELYMRH